MAAPSDAPLDPTSRPPAGPNHRKLAIVLVLGVVVIAAAVVGALSRENESNRVDDVSAALAANAAVLSGPLNPSELQHTRCVADSDTRYTCTPVMDNAQAKNGIVVEWKDEVITKHLAGSSLTAAPRSGDEVAAALSADEQATMGRTLEYGCAFTQGMNPDGSQAASSPGGFRCAAPKPDGGKDEFIQRYVEFATDGTVKRDFMLTANS